MRTPTTLSAFLAGTLMLISSAVALPGDHIVDTLHKAVASPSPIPLLEKAKQQLKHFNVGPDHLRSTAAGVSAQAQAATELKAREVKGRAMKHLNEAIELAKKGQKIDGPVGAAIGEIHHAGSIH